LIAVQNFNTAINIAGFACLLFDCEGMNGVFVCIDLATPISFIIHIIHIFYLFQLMHCGIIGANSERKGNSMRLGCSNSLGSWDKLSIAPLVLCFALTLSLAARGETWYNTRVNNGKDTTAQATCLICNPGLWTNSVGETATEFSAVDSYVVSSGQTLRMGEVTKRLAFTGGTIRFGDNGTAGNFTHDNYRALSFPYGLILERGRYLFNKSPASNLAVGVMNGGMATVTASEENPFSLYSNHNNRYLVFNNGIATESDTNVLSLGGDKTNFTFFAMGDLSGYTGRIVVDYTGSFDIRWATRLCLGERTLPGTIQVKGKAAISAFSGVLTDPKYADTMPTRSPCVCTVGSLEMEPGSVICVAGRNKTSKLAATNGLIRVNTAFSACGPVYVRPDWNVEVTKENRALTILTVPSSQELSASDFILDTTGLAIPQELVLEVRNDGLEKQLVITKKKYGFIVIVRG